MEGSEMDGQFICIYFGRKFDKVFMAELTKDPFGVQADKREGYIILPHVEVCSCLVKKPR